MGIAKPRGKPSEPEHRVNGKIRAKEVLVIGEEGEQFGHMSPEEALQLAQDADLDLVEVSPNATPPVCRIMDYGKYLYDAKKGAKGRQPRLETKEIRVRPKTGDHDIDVKIKRARRFLTKGHKVQLTMLLRGRERAHPDRAEGVLLDVAALLTDISKIESHPRLTHNRMSMLFAPDKAAIARIEATRKAEEEQAARAAEKAAVEAAAPAAETEEKAEAEAEKEEKADEVEAETPTTTDDTSKSEDDAKDEVT